MTLENVNSASWSEFHKIKKIQTELVLKIKGSKVCPNLEIPCSFQNCKM